MNDCKKCGMPTPRTLCEPCWNLQAEEAMRKIATCDMADLHETFRRELTILGYPSHLIEAVIRGFDAPITHHNVMSRVAGKMR